MHLSSGTAGKPIEVYWHYNDEMISNLSLWRLRAKFYNIKPDDKFCTLHSTNYSWNRIMDYKSVVFSKDKKILSLCKLFFDEENMMHYYDEIIKFKPIWLFFQPSNFIKITEFMVKNNLTIPSSIKYIEFTGESLLPRAIELVKEYYNCDYANMYGTTETNGIAYQCPFGNMHILDENVFVEMPENNFGKAIITSLTNRVFPLIRYEIGDIIKIEKSDDCECGLSGFIIDEIVGRQQNFVKLNDGNTISEIIIMSIIERVNSIAGNAIKEYKAQISISGGIVTLIVYIDYNHRSWEKKIEEAFVATISQNFGNMFKNKIVFTYNPIKIESNGKFSILEVVK